VFLFVFEVTYRQPNATIAGICSIGVYLRAIHVCWLQNIRVLMYFYYSYCSHKFEISKILKNQFVVFSQYFLHLWNKKLNIDCSTNLCLNMNFLSLRNDAQMLSPWSVATISWKLKFRKKSNFFTIGLPIGHISFLIILKAPTRNWLSWGDDRWKPR
jgi:hypothetical protein